MSGFESGFFKCIYVFKDNHFIGAPIYRSGSAGLFENILLELRATARKARTASASDTLDVPSIHEGEKPMVVSPSWLPFFLPRPSDEQSLLDLIFSVFTGARIRGGTKGRRRPKHLR